MSNAVYVAWDGVTPATILPDAVGLLRRELRFRGTVVSADLGATTVVYPLTLQAAAVQALRAGCDLLYLPDTAKDQERAYQGVLKAVRSGAISRLRLATAVRHVLALKIAEGVIRPDGTPIKLRRPPKPQPVAPPVLPGAVPAAATP
jgi:beta-N-acetylhexosaminidase